ncbi:SAM-dependent methyltransferase [[Phormidium ambiguum] IAM M-71]|uniref:SAM-dependent methyltransferase n=1 Tax=[Phormidium ambiguum] IAM M-71 TaxID=454136 RepID=A0A1U7IGN4_9CYAN|nr:methyltransferase [Phormidium ambiguum]OKH36191.1 SAM-dependent methyltransferase [Phormidium ambiguum IAM M-71]
MEIISSLTETLLYEKVKETQPYSWFPSSPELIELIIEQAQIVPGCYALEPTAGDGLLAQAMVKAGAIVDVIEINPLLQQILFQKGFNLVGSDFLTAVPQRQYNFILANPPFSTPEIKGVDLDIIQRAYNLFLANSGRLVSVVSNSMNVRNEERVQAFRAFLKRTSAKVLELPLEIFWGSERPVTVESYLVVIDKISNVPYL